MHLELSLDENSAVFCWRFFFHKQSIILFAFRTPTQIETYSCMFASPIVRAMSNHVEKFRLWFLTSKNHLDSNWSARATEDLQSGLIGSMRTLKSLVNSFCSWNFAVNLIKVIQIVPNFQGSCRVSWERANLLSIWVKLHNLHGRNLHTLRGWFWCANYRDLTVCPQTHGVWLN